MLSAGALWFLILSPAHAGESESRDLLFTDSWDVFESLDFDTGQVPANSPLGVRLYVDSQGGYDAEIEGVSDLWWPDALSHGIVGLPEGGWMSLVTDVEIAAEVIVDLSPLGLGVVTVPVWSEEVVLADEVVFDGLLLDDSATSGVEVSSEGQIIGPIEYSQSIFTGVELVFSAYGMPVSQASLEGVRIDTDEQTYLRESDVGVFQIPTDDPGELGLTSTWYGRLDASFDLVVVPGVEVCAPVIGCLTLVSFDLPIPLATVGEERAFTPVLYSHPLPWLGLDLATFDFGDVLVGNTANLQLPLDNLGLLDLEGDVVLGGDAAFSVYPGAFYAPQSDSDGVVISFTPPEVGQFTTIATLSSNDPERPVIEIPIVGVGYVDAPPPTLPGEAKCGCATGPAGGGAAFVVGLLALFRRRAART